MAEPPRRGRAVDNGPAAAPEAPSAQDMWLASQGANLGNANAAPPSGLGLGGDPAFEYRRGRAEAPSPFPAPVRSSRRAPAYDNPNAAGTVSAPLSPSRLYAQLEIGRGPSAPAPAPWPPAFEGQRGGFGAPGMPVGRPTARDLSIPPSGLHQSHTPEPGSPLSTFAPFSPPALSSSLRPSSAEGKHNGSYISPSTLLSPAPPAGQGKLPKDGGLAQSFSKLGVGEKTP